jgi:hypothetical protein
MAKVSFTDPSERWFMCPASRAGVMCLFSKGATN